VRFELEHFELPPGARTLLHVQVGNTFLSPHEFSLDIRCACERQNVARPVVRVDPYNGVTVNPQQIEFGVLTRRMLRGRMPLCVTLSGDALKHYEPAVRSLPPYLKVAGIENDGAGCRVLFEFDEEWSGFDLGGSAVLDFLQRDCRTVRGSSQVRFHGFVRD
jgi:hypothetical protein